MLLFPKKIKFKFKRKRYLRKFMASRRTRLNLGLFGIKTLEKSHISAKQIEAVRQVVNRSLKRTGKIWIRVFPDLPISKKPSENRMGKGKGKLSYWCSAIKAGTIFIELGGNISIKNAIIALNKGRAKMPIPTKIVFR
jgi:large subunit ribosomal protein L16|tara:strand:+ start:268 stop:681 length:414 start_codon:yes stop_codon:yes gene_type:complete